VLGLILTFDAPDSLAGCLGALQDQTHAPDDTLVVDNASPDPVDGVVAGLPAVRVQRLGENLGPAGGYAAGLRAFVDSDADYAWVMDDDCRPEPDALAEQLELARSYVEPCVVLATVVDADTRVAYRGHGWCGVLIPRSVVEAVGVPNEDLFWWTEDTEYLQWRIPNAGFAVLWSPARVAVTRRAAAVGKPAWKYYYETRNQVFHRLHVQGSSNRYPVPRHLRARVRVWRAGRAFAKLGVRAAVRERDDRTRKLVMVVRGGWDGVRGRIGRTVAVDGSDRPAAAR
jgi:rhamnopyranosyl-N-acetylglucosaminyl-diphospho-decaprenol beta-1,3/1,4-galactofuranosyltransferase